MCGVIINNDPDMRLNLDAKVPGFQKKQDYFTINGGSKPDQCYPILKFPAFYGVELDLPESVQLGGEIQLKVKGKGDEGKYNYIWQVIDHTGAVREFVGLKAKVAFCALGEVKIDLRVVEKISGQQVAKASKSVTVRYGKYFVEGTPWEFPIKPEKPLMPIFPNQPYWPSEPRDPWRLIEPKNPWMPLTPRLPWYKFNQETR